MNNSFITKLTVSVVTVAALLAFLAPVTDESDKGVAAANYSITTCADDDETFDSIKNK